MAILTPLRIFIETEKDGNHFLRADELIERSSRLLSFTFVTPLTGRYTVPALCGYGDIALWVSTDRPIGFDPAQLWKQLKVQELCPVYVPKDEHGKPFPSMMLFRNKYCERLTSAYLFSATPPELRPEVWAGGLGNIGTLEV